MYRLFYFVLVLIAGACLTRQALGGQKARDNRRVRVVPVGKGWAKSSVNAVVFRTNSVVTHKNTQYIAYYDAKGDIILGKRKLGTSNWEVKHTPYAGQVKDAHNSISIAVDGKGILHMCWNMHGQPLRYAQSRRPGSLELTEPMPMTRREESRVTYPQFYNLPGGDLLFLYRQGGSGSGDVLLNRYDVRKGQWQALQHPLIAGQGRRNAYMNGLSIDGKGGLHISWVWRETPDVATNHDVCYAYSPDQGKTWQTSSGKKFTLPITAKNAEVAQPVPQNSDLINQTSMTVDAHDRPLIATYWRSQGSDVPQYRLVWHDGRKWRTSIAGERKRAFHLSGGGTRRIPVSRPQVLAGKDNRVYVVFRDEERGGGVSVAISESPNRADWRLATLYKPSVGAWEPTYDPALWKREGKMHLFLQTVGQGQGETLENVPPQTVSVLEWTP